jgi:Ala-tRNA(Pro) deacylase
VACTDDPHGCAILPIAPEEFAMSIAPTLQRYLADQNTAYDMIEHRPTMSAMRTAEAAHISGDCLAKGILLRNSDGYMLAVIPASRHISMPDLKAELGQDVDLASEDEIGQVFRDCEHGAVPAVGTCYGVQAIVDDQLAEQPEIYFEAGDHATLIHLSQAEFARLTAAARHGRFSIH